MLPPSRSRYGRYFRIHFSPFLLSCIGITNLADLLSYTRQQTLVEKEFALPIVCGYTLTVIYTFRPRSLSRKYPRCRSRPSALFCVYLSIKCGCHTNNIVCLATVRCPQLSMPYCCNKSYSISYDL